MKKKVRKHYSDEEAMELEDKYYEAFGNRPPHLICVSSFAVLELVEKALERGTPITDKEISKLYPRSKDPNVVY